MSGNLVVKFWTNNQVKQLARLSIIALSLNILADATVLSNSLLAIVPVSIDQTSVTRLAVLAALASGDNSFSKVFPSQVSQLSAITTALTTAITPSGASKPNPPINNFMPAWLNDQNCSNPGDCALKYIPLALALYKLNNFSQVTAAQYTNLMANLFYAGANANLANNQLLKATQKIALLLPPLTPAIVANFFVPNVNQATYAGLALDPDSGILVKTPSGTPTGTASQFCTDLVTANVLDFQSTPTMPLTVNNVWLGAICTDSTQCCGNNICNTTSGANLGSTLGGKPYGYCDQPPCLKVPCGAGYVCDLTLNQCVVACVPVGDQANSVQDCCPSANQQSSPTIFINGNTCAPCAANSNNCIIFGDGTNSCCSGFCNGGTCQATCNPGQSCCTATGNDPVTNQPLCPAGIFSCCSSDYSCALTNGDITGNAGNKCCIAGAASPGNQALPCITNSTDGDGARGDSNCCTGAMCIVDPTDSNHNGYCVNCIANPSSYYINLGVVPPVCTADSSGVQCCDDQQLNCVPIKPATGPSVNNCVPCIGQSCANGVSCCSTTVVPGITCGTLNDGTNTPNTCCIGANAACTADQQCCTGNNCFNSVCTTCGSQGATCSSTALCCTTSTSIATELYCDIPTGAASGSCQLLLGAACTTDNNICSSSDKLYCDIPTGATTGTCKLCLGSACSTTGGACVSGCNDSNSNFCATTGIGLNAKNSCTACLGSACTGTTCATNCDSTIYTCSNSKCVLSTPAPKPGGGSAPDNSFTWSSTDTIIASVGVGIITLMVFTRWRRSRSGEFTEAVVSPGKGEYYLVWSKLKSSQPAGESDLVSFVNLLKKADPLGYAKALALAEKDSAFGISIEVKIFQYWKPDRSNPSSFIQELNASQIKAAAEKGPIVNQDTIELLKYYKDSGLLSVSGANYSDIIINIGEGASKIVIKLSAVRKSKIDAVISVPSDNPNVKSPLVAAAMNSYIDEIVTKFSKKEGGYSTVDALLDSSPDNLTVMREYWTAKYAQMIADDATNQYENSISDYQIFTEMLKDARFKSLFYDSAVATYNLQVASELDSHAGGYFVTKFKALILPEGFDVIAYAARYVTLYNSEPKLAKFASMLSGAITAIGKEMDAVLQAKAMYAFEQAANELPLQSGDSWNTDPGTFFE